jgi:hypothetical protein
LGTLEASPTLEENLTAADKKWLAWFDALPTTENLKATTPPPSVGALKLGIKKRRGQRQYGRGVITDDDGDKITGETVITGVQTVITDDDGDKITGETVITGVQTVITQLKIVDEAVFEYGDRLIKALKQDFQRESDNLRTGNGVVNTILDRIDDEVQYRFEKVIQDRNVIITPKLKVDICRWLEREYYPFVNNYRRPKTQLLLSDDWREGTKLRRA